MSIGEPDRMPRLPVEKARQLALEHGFAEAGLLALPHPNEARDADRFVRWVQAGRAGTMHYLSRTAEDGQLVRSRVDIPFPWARSVLVCFALYNSAQPKSIEPAAPDAGWIARYAWSSRKDAQGMRRPSDYHKVLLKRMRAVEQLLHAELGAFESRAYVDTGPVVERALATAAGLGWTGKNTCLIHPQLGSFGFLAVLVTSLEVETASPPLAIPDRCGTCTRCLDACPTGALVAPYEIDATRCISYLTIEHKGPIDAALMPGMGRQVFGCDICQDVCPWNSKAPISLDAELAPREELVNPALDWLAELDEAEFECEFNGSPIRRAGVMGLRRNVAIAIGNSRIKRFANKLQLWSAVENEGLRKASQWALEKLNSQSEAQSDDGL